MVVYGQGTSSSGIGALPTELPEFAFRTGLEPATTRLLNEVSATYATGHCECWRTKSVPKLFLAGEQTVRIVALPLSYPNFHPERDSNPQPTRRSNRILRHRPRWFFSSL